MRAWDGTSIRKHNLTGHRRRRHLAILSFQKDDLNGLVRSPVKVALGAKPILAGQTKRASALTVQLFCEGLEVPLTASRATERWIIPWACPSLGGKGASFLHFQMIKLDPKQKALPEKDVNTAL